MSHYFPCKLFQRICAGLMAVALIAVAAPARAGTPSYIGPYTYGGYFMSGPGSANGFSTESAAAQAGVGVAADLNGNHFCAYHIGSSPASPWQTSGPYVSYIEGVESRSEHSSYTILYSLVHPSLGCLNDDGSAAGWVVVRTRLVCSSTQIFDALINKCVAVSPEDIKAQKGANGGKTCPFCGKPINPGTGSMWHVEPDFRPGGSASPLTLERMYNSNRYAEGQFNGRSFGARWFHKYDAALSQTFAELAFIQMRCWRRQDNNELICPPPPVPEYAPIPSAVKVDTGDGKSYLFNLNPGLVWTGDADTSDRVYATLNGDNTVVSSWSYVSAKDGSTMRFDERGVLLSITAQNGVTETLTYSTGQTNDTTVSRYPADAPTCAIVQEGGTVSPRRLLCVTDSWGRQLHFKYDDTDRVVEAIDPNNRSYYYEYDGASGGCPVRDTNNRACGANNLTKVTYPGGASRVYFYNEASRINGGTLCNRAIPPVGGGFGQLLNMMTGLVDENGVRHLNWTYDCDGRATMSEVANGVEKVKLSYIVYSDGGTDATVTHYVGDPSAPQTTVRVYKSAVVRGTQKNKSIDQPCVECGSIQSRNYDVNGNLSNTIDFNGIQTSYTYDMARNLELTRSESNNAYSATQRKITTAWHSTFRLPLQIAEPKRITTFTYDAVGNVLTRSEQATSDLSGNSGFSASVVGVERRWTYTYNTTGQLTSVTGPRTDVADVTSYAYDSSGNLSTVTNALGHITTLTDYNGAGQVGRIIFPNGAATVYSYSPRGWVSGKATTAGGQTESTVYEYDSAGQLKKVTLPDLSTLSYTYDDAHRLTAIADSIGNSISYTLDLTGNRTAEQVKDATGALTRNVSRIFDTLNRVQQQTGSAQ